ncbi:MAG: serine hydrolase domain-containing protein [Kordiimonas sp.]
MIDLVRRIALISLLVIGQSAATAQDAATIEEGSLCEAGGAYVAGSAFAKHAVTYADGIVNSVMAAHEIAGLTLAVVKDGKPIILKGYGYADAPAGKRVDPFRSMFRVGSISKLFTWVAVMQLEEQGKLDLSENVNVYLKSFQLPEPHGVPLTLKDIMAHRPGYEEGGAGYMSARDPGGVISLKAKMERYVPAQVRAPSVAVSYSNYAVGLAGLIVEEVSGQPFNEYVEDHIFTPLGMKYSSFREPVGEGYPEGNIAQELERHLAKGHWRWGGKHREAAYEFLGASPSGGASNSAADMARFMIAMMQGGALGDARILKSETVERMKERSSKQFLTAHGFSHGFMNGWVAGHETFGHGGALSDFTSMMKYVPELGFGVFVSVNQAKGAHYALKVPDLLIERLFPAKRQLEDIEPAAEFAADREKFEGYYMNNRRNFSMLESIMYLYGKDSEVSIAPNGVLELWGARGTTYWIQIGPLSFRKSDSAAILNFAEDADGNILRYQTSSGTASHEKVGFFDLPDFFFFALGCAGLFTVTMFGTCFYQWKQRGMGAFGLSEKLAFAVSVGGLLFFAALYYVRESSQVEPWRFMYEFPGVEFMVLVWASLTMSGLMFVLLYSLLPLWRDLNGKLVGRLHHTAYAASGVILVAALWKWNLLGFYYY